MSARKRNRCFATFCIVAIFCSGEAAFAQAGGLPGAVKPDRDAPLIAGAPAARAATPVERTRIGDAAPPARGIITSISAPDLIVALTDAGFPARWVNASDGERILVAQLDESTPFQVLLQDCVSAQNHCVDFELSFGVNIAKPPSAEQINRWNRDKTWAAFAYLTPQGAPALRAQYTLAGGVSPEHLKILLKAWGASLRGFLTHIAYSPEGTRAAAAKP